MEQASTDARWVYKETVEVFLTSIHKYENFLLYKNVNRDIKSTKNLSQLEICDYPRKFFTR